MQACENKSKELAMALRVKAEQEATQKWVRQVCKAAGASLPSSNSSSLAPPPWMPPCQQSPTIATAMSPAIEFIREKLYRAPATHSRVATHRPSSPSSKPIYPTHSPKSPSSPSPLLRPSPLPHPAPTRATKTTTTPCRHRRARCPAQASRLPCTNVTINFRQ